MYKWTLFPLVGLKTNRHNMTKPVPSCWPNAQKAKHYGGPHVIHFQSYCTPCEKRMRILPKTKNNLSLNFQIYTVTPTKLNHKWIKQGSSMQHGNFVWYNSSVCGTCIATDSMLYDNISSQIHKCTLCFYFIYLD